MGFADLFSLVGKKILFTGGAGYLGSTIVEGMLDFGAQVVVADVKEVPKENIVERTELHDRLYVVVVDLANTDSVKQMMAKANGIMGGIDVLVTAAANLGAGVLDDIESMGDEYWQKGMDGTVGYTFRTIREAIPYLKKEKAGSIINFGSLYAVGAPDPRTYLDTPFSSTPNYGAGKAATIELTKYCAAYLAKYNIRANSVSPGSYPHLDVQKNELFRKRLADKTMLGRIGYPKDLVGAFIFLASDASAYITGINIMVDGGQTAW